MSKRAHTLIGLAALLAAYACSPVGSSEFDTGGGQSTKGAGTGGDGGAPGAGGAGGEEEILTGVGGGNPQTNCDATPTQDKDGDGWTIVDGDCNDCDANVNPGAIEVIDTEPDDEGNIPEPADEDCDGQIDNVAPPCDAGIALTDFDGQNGARTIDLCKFTQADATGKNKTWGVIESKYVRASGAAINSPTNQVGVLENFGPNVNVQEGERLLVLSSGRARLPNQTGACGSASCTGFMNGTPPPGFPQGTAGCPIGSTINDDVGLEVKVRVPTNATGYSFLFSFYSFEHPQWVCQSYNDQFIALVTPPPQGALGGNITFDSLGNPVSVNAAFFEVCSGCPLGTAELQGTGFDTWDFQGAGATSWLKTQAPVEGGSDVTIRFAIWDTSDTAFDSTVLIDGFQWIASGGTPTVGTDPIVPK